MYQTIDHTTHTLNTLPLYATIASFKGMLRPSVTDTHPPTTMAVDVLDGPIETYTTAPHFVLKYLYDNQERDVPTKELYNNGQRKGYRTKDIRRSIREFLPQRAHVGVWWNSRNKTEYARWYEPDALTDHVQECLNRGVDW